MNERARLPTIRTYEIVVGIDYSLVSARALHTALDLAKKRTGSRVHFLAIASGEGTPSFDDSNDEARGSFLQNAHHTLDEYVEQQLTNREGLVNRKSIRTAVDFGDPAERILALAKDVNANLIVLGTHSKSNLERTAVGSVTQQVLREAPCSVLVVRADDEH